MKRKYHLWLAIAVLGMSVGCRSARQTGATEQTPPRNRKILTGVSITSITVETFPRYSKSGESWDAYAPFKEKPDPYLTLTWNEKELYESETLDEAVWPGPLSFSRGLPVDIMPFDKPVLLELHDEDGLSADDNMGYFQVVLKDYEKTRQARLSTPGGELAITLALEFMYD